MWSALDLALRFVYVMVAPFVLVALSTIVPIGGVLAGVGIATVVALFGTDRWRAKTARIPLIGKPLAKLATLGDYYRENPPKPLVYYIVYPLLAPYWLFVRKARQEFLLYRKINLVAFVMPIGFGAYEYVTKWDGIPFTEYFVQTFVLVLFQLVITMALVMPIVTTIVVYHARGKRKLLAALLLLATGVAVLSGVYAMKRDKPHPFTIRRMYYRAQNAPKQAVEVMFRALTAASVEYAGSPANHAAALSVARTKLETYWQADEARVFSLFRAENGVTIIYVNRRRKPTIWIGRAPDGKVIIDPRTLPPDARAKLARPRIPRERAAQPPAQ